MKNFWLNRKKVEPIVNFDSSDLKIWGTTSALDRVSLRRAIIVVKKEVQRLVRENLFEPEGKLIAVVSDYLFSIIGSKYIRSYQVCSDYTLVIFADDVRLRVTYEKTNQHS